MFSVIDGDLLQKNIDKKTKRLGKTNCPLLSRLRAVQKSLETIHFLLMVEDCCLRMKYKVK